MVMDGWMIMNDNGWMIYYIDEIDEDIF